MKKTVIGSLFVGIAILLSLSARVSAQAKDQPIIIKAVTYAPVNSLAVEPAPIFVERVNKKAKGRLKIDLLGGPEVVAPFDQPVALKSGAIDMLAYIPHGYLKSIIPEAEAKGLSELAEWEERKTGAFELWSEIFAKKANAKYLGRFHNLSPFLLYCNKKIDKIEDFRGMKIRCMSLYMPFIKALGAAPVTTPPTEIYTSLERGTVDGTMWPTHGMISWGFHEVLKYAVEPGVFQIEPATLMNLDKWNKIPKDLQELVIEEMKDMEYIGSMHGFMIAMKEDAVRKKAGMKYIQLPPGDAEKYRKIAYEKTWEYVIASSPQYGPKLKELTSKKALPKGAFPWMD